MKRGELESESESIERAVDLLDRLFATADGGQSIAVGQYEASTILALLMDKEYRLKVTSQLNDFPHMDTDD